MNTQGLRSSLRAVLSETASLVVEFAYEANFTNILKSALAGILFPAPVGRKGR